jgi:diacylglycerol kinase
MKDIFDSFRNAWRGVVYVFSKEQNFRIEAAAAAAVTLTMLILPVKRWEAVVLFFVILLVLILEVLNTMVERLVNIFRPKMHPYAGKIKDLMAAAVFLAALGSVIIGIVIFWPYFFS